MLNTKYNFSRFYPLYDLLKIHRILLGVSTTLQTVSVSTRANHKEVIVFSSNSKFRPLKMAASKVTSRNGGNNCSSILQQVLDEFNRPDVIKISNRKNVEKLLAEIVGSGSKSFQIITDFDHTVTRHHLNGQPCDALHGVMAYSPEMPQDYRDKTQKLFNKYYPIEISHELTEEEKLPFMIEWYEKAHELIISTGVEKDFLKQLVGHSKCRLRDNAAEMFKTLNDHNVPVLIFSAGLGDLLDIALEQNKIIYPNIKVVSNYMEFDPITGKICGFKPPLIHTLNKNEAGLFEGDTYFMDLAHRGNAFVIGDNIGDSLMGDGMKDPGAILKIGFLNDRIEERLDSFMETFDIVLCDDQSMDFINLVLKYLL